MAVRGKVGSVYPERVTMSRLFYRPSEQLEGIRPYFPLLHGIALVDDLRAISGIISVLLLPGCLLRMGDS